VHGAHGCGPAHHGVSHHGGLVEHLLALELLLHAHHRLAALLLTHLAHLAHVTHLAHLSHVAHLAHVAHLHIPPVLPIPHPFSVLFLIRLHYRIQHVFSLLLTHQVRYLKWLSDHHFAIHIFKCFQSIFCLNVAHESVALVDFVFLVVFLNDFCLDLD